MEKKIERLLTWMKGGRAFPLTMELNITNRCNLKCLSCWQRSAKIDYDDELSDEKWMEIVQDAGRIGVKEIRIPGSGEPMMRKDLVLDLITETSRSGMNTLLITNGTLFDERTIKQMIGKIDNVTFSIDGPNPEINDYLRGKGSFEKATKAVEKFNFWKKRLKKKKPFLRLNVVISNKNYDKLGRMIDLAHDLGCGAVSFQPMTVFSKFGEEMRLNEDQLDELPGHIKRAIKNSKEYGIHTNLNEFMKEEAKKANEMDDLIDEVTRDIKNPFLSLPCFEPWYNMIIMPNGSVGQCSVFGGNGENVKQKTIEEIWFGKYFNGIRKRLISKNLFHYCKNCCVPVFEENRRLRQGLMKYGNKR
ncbi:MAG: radical SAM protein [Candidatus Aenigmarchaeota archaeon]|nr:radical SAM protein [Candidatus Aenigmarchaeota archaeon]